MITRIAIKNFRSLDVDFTLDPVTVIVGRSGTGKTNVIDALRFLRKALSPQQQTVDPKANVYSVTLSSIEPLSVRISFCHPKIYNDFVYECSFIQMDTVINQGIQEKHPNSVILESLSMGDTVLFSREANRWLVEPRMYKVPELKWQSLVLPSISGVQEISFACLMLTDGLGCYDFPGTVCSEESKDGVRQEAGMLDDALNYAATLSHIRSNLSRVEDWQEIIGALKRLNNKVESVDMDNQQQRKRLIVGHRLADDKVFMLDIANESEGFRRFLAHLLALYQTPPKQTLIFEEPEKGIHPGALETLAEELKAAPLDGRGQVILTTHSPALLDQFDPESIRVAEMKEHVTKIGKLVPEQLDSLKEELLRPGELFTVDPARMAEMAIPPSKVAEE